jgi:hypothetical protein
MREDRIPLKAMAIASLLALLIVGTSLVIWP